ncbi:MAG: bifunctional homocysteine S-methyltransferase/methylenetetrahydrofolate reductase [Candidatus Polarisedimenticolia bacterium]
MSRDFLDLLSRRVVLFDGGMGTELYARGVFVNRCYEELNLARPELVEEVHRSFLLAGAEVVETNSFGGNRLRLERHALGEKVREINVEAARIARRAAGREAFVAGSVGPLGIRLEPWGATSVAEAEALFREQMEALAEGGVDLLVLETFADLVEVQAAVRAARAVGGLPVAALMTVDEEGRTPEGVPPEWVARRLEEAGADVVGVNCSVGPAAMLSVVEAMATVASRPLAALPNAGLPRAIEGRMHYLASPTYMARCARRFVDAGARVVGGCCGVTPEHVRAMSEALGGVAPREIAPRVVVAPSAEPACPRVAAAAKSALAAKIDARLFVSLVELPPPRGWETAARRAEIRALAAAGVDAALVADDPRLAGARLAPLAFAAVVLEEARAGDGTPEPLLQYSCRDRNLLGMQSDLLGAHALGVRNLMLVTGQLPRPGEPIWATPVFDVDAVGLANVAHRLNGGLDVGDNAIGAPTAFFVGVEATPASPERAAEVDRLAWKIDAGAEVVFTKPVFDVDDFLSFLAAVEPFRPPVVAAVWPPRSARELETLAAETPGVSVPQAMVDRMAEAATPEAAEEIGLAIAGEVARALRPHVEGLLFCGKLGRDPRALALLAAVRGDGRAAPRVFGARPGFRGAV